MLKLYDTEISGNCYKVRLLLSFLNLEYERIPVDLKAQQQKAQDFLKLNILGQVPVLQDEEIIIRDSQAILMYLGQRYGSARWLPEGASGLAKMVQWLSSAANEIANGLAPARAFYTFNHKSVDIERVTARAQGFLKAMDKHLETRVWLETENPTIADVACFPYIALAHEGKIAIGAYPHVAAWVARFKLLPGFITMPGVS